MDYSPWGRKESDMTERLHFHFQAKSYSAVDKIFVINLRGIKEESLLQGLMLKLKLQYFSHLMQRAD